MDPLKVTFIAHPHSTSNSSQHIALYQQWHDLVGSYYWCKMYIQRFIVDHFFLHFNFTSMIVFCRSFYACRSYSLFHTLWRFFKSTHQPEIHYFIPLRSWSPEGDGDNWAHTSRIFELHMNALNSTSRIVEVSNKVSSRPMASGVRSRSHTRA